MSSTMPARRAIGRAWRSNGGPLVFVWGMWLVLSIALVSFVRACTVDVPYFDEWELVPAIAGEQPITLQWLWSQHNEHRIFLPRLIYVGLERAGGDFRTGALFSACLLSAAAAALIGVARQLRGRATYSDAFFPLLLLNWGQTQNLVWSFQIQFVGSSVLAVAALLPLVKPGRMTFRAAVALGTCTILLPLFGGNGLALVPALAACVFLAGWDMRCAEPRGTAKAVAVSTLGLLALALVAFYFVDYQRPAAHPPSDSLGRTLEGAIQFLTMGLGPIAQAGWPLTGYALLTSLCATVVALVATAVSGSPRSWPARRLLLFLGSLCSLALGVSWSRCRFGPGSMFFSRYVTLAAPLYCVMFFAWESLDRPMVRQLARVLLFFLAALVLIPNAEHGMQEGPLYRDLRASVIADLRAGIPSDELAKRHSPVLYFFGADVLAARMRMLHAHGIGVFKDLKE